MSPRGAKWSLLQEKAKVPRWVAVEEVMARHMIFGKTRVGDLRRGDAIGNTRTGELAQFLRHLPSGKALIAHIDDASRTREVWQDEIESVHWEDRA